MTLYRWLISLAEVASALMRHTVIDRAKTRSKTRSRGRFAA